MITPSFIYGTAWKEERTTELVELAIASGFKAIDTAGQPKHYQEDLVGAALINAFNAGLSRDSLFIQTKFTPLDGHDERVPYDPSKTLAAQVRQSFENSLANLGLDFIDCYLLHGPYSHPYLGSSDWEVWREMETLLGEGKIGAIGISNVNPMQLRSLAVEADIKPSYVQNRCYASRGWDAEVRSVCEEFGIVYQGFSLLTANSDVVRGETVSKLAAKYDKTPQQVIYRFAMHLGILPLCGSTNVAHMSEALAAESFELESEEIALLSKVAA